MSYLTINGYVVPVEKDSLKIDNIEIGGRERSFRGDALSGVRAIKRKISGRTTPMLPDDVALIRAFLQGDFDTFFSQSRDLSSGKGVVGTGGPGDIVYYKSDGGQYLSLSGYGAPKLVGDPDFAYWGFVGASTNLLTANIRSVETNTTGFTAIDSAIISRVASPSWYESHSLKVVTGSAVNAVQGGVYCEGTVTGTKLYCMASVYVTGVGSVKIRIQNTTAGTSAYSIPVTLEPGKWTRLHQFINRTTAATNIRISVVEAVADSGITFYCDGFSLTNADSNIVFAFGDPTTETPADVSWSFWEMIGDVQEFTVLLWARIRDDTGVVPFRAANWDGTSYIELKLTSSNPQLTVCADGATTVVGTDDPCNGNEWELFGFTFSRGATPKMQIMVNDARANWYAYANPTYMPRLGDLATLVSDMAGCDVCDMMVFKKAITRAAFAVLYAGWTKMINAPYLNVEGDAITAAVGRLVGDDDQPAALRMLGKVAGQKQGGGCRSDGTWDNNLTVLEFELEEA